MIFLELKLWQDALPAIKPIQPSLEPDAIMDQNVSEETGDRRSIDVHLQLWLFPLVASNKQNLGTERHRLLRKKNDAMSLHRFLMKQLSQEICVFPVQPIKMGFVLSMSKHFKSNYLYIESRKL